MRLLLDTHTLIWWLAGHETLSPGAKAMIAEPGNEIYVSAASAWEIATKVRIGKLPDANLLAADMSAAIRDQNFVALPISIEHAQAAGALPGPHKDPFDRMLIAQSMHEQMPIVTNDAAFAAYTVRCVW